MQTKTMLPPARVPDIQHTKPEVFIIESLDKKDEKAKRFEGEVLATMLRLAGKNPKYYYFQSKDELPHLVGLYRQSQYRYLHISSHASDTHISLTNCDLTYSEFADYFNGHLKLRRLFFSACQVGNRNFVSTISSVNKGMHSIIAPIENIQFDHAAALWSALYVSMFTKNISGMKNTDLIDRIKALRILFPVNLYCATYNSVAGNWIYRKFLKK
ncbi:MAG: hypothetical protein HQK81_09745 [Desulfovibrionaceae bacterium]|nr:hypothetical protein [Desulfovibrionaceae bacterium]MBF0514321.1 hypothetical protein [Desulfovibrionaceae bacterium]